MWWLFWIFVIACMIVFIVAKNQAEQYTATSRRIAANLDYHIQRNGFSIDKKITAGDGILLIDNTKKKWSAVSHRNTQPKIYDFNELIEFEVYEDGNSIAKGRSGSALAGGLLFGNTGAIIGSAGSKEIKNTCTVLQIRIRANDINTPEIIMSLINSQTNKDSSIYRAKIDSAKQMASNLSYIQYNGREGGIS